MDAGLTVAAKSNERLLGLLSAAGVFCIWSGFLVFSRAGLQSGLTPFDLTALRFVVAGALILPFAIAWWPRHLPLHATLAMSICGPGALYTGLMYFGLKDSSAAYGGVFANGSLPIFTILLGFFVARSVPSWRQLLAVLILVVGAVLVGVPGLLPSTLPEAPWSTILLQAAFQGLGPGFLAVILFSISARILGPTPSAGLAAAPRLKRR